MHRQFFRKISQNPEYVERFCNGRNNPFHFACRKWYLYNSPQCWYSKKYLKRITLYWLFFRFFFVNFIGVSGSGFVDISINIFPFETSSMNSTTSLSSPSFSI